MFAHPCTAMVRGRAIQNSLNPPSAFSTSTPCSLLLFFSFVFIPFLPSTSLSPPSPATLSYPSPSFTLTPHLSTSPCPLLPISLHLLIHSPAPSPLFHPPTHPFHTTLTLLPSLLVIPSSLPITCLSSPLHLQCQFPSLSPFLKLLIQFVHFLFFIHLLQFVSHFLLFHLLHFNLLFPSTSFTFHHSVDGFRTSG